MQGEAPPSARGPPSPSWHMLGRRGACSCYVRLRPPGTLRRSAAMTDVGEVTRLLRSARAGEPAALERLVPLVYEDLRRLARRQLSYEHGERTLNPTALVHESYLKMSAGILAAEDRAHFLALAARVMRQVLVD